MRQIRQHKCETESIDLIFVLCGEWVSEIGVLLCGLYVVGVCVGEQSLISKDRPLSRVLGLARPLEPEH